MLDGVAQAHVARASPSIARKRSPGWMPASSPARHAIPCTYGPAVARVDPSRYRCARLPLVSDVQHPGTGRRPGSAEVRIGVSAIAMAPRSGVLFRQTGRVPQIAGRSSRGVKAPPLLSPPRLSHATLRHAERRGTVGVTMGGWTTAGSRPFISRVRCSTGSRRATRLDRSLSPGSVQRCVVALPDQAPVRSATSGRRRSGAEGVLATRGPAFFFREGAASSGWPQLPQGGLRARVTRRVSAR